jgi:hypothetical protein
MAAFLLCPPSHGVQTAPVGEHFRVLRRATDKQIALLGREICYSTGLPRTRLQKEWECWWGVRG